MRFAAVVLIALFLTSSSQGAPQRRVALETNDCNGISWTVEGLVDTDEEPLAYADGVVRRMMTGNVDVAVLGATARAVWVLETFSTTDSGCEPFCTVLRAREVRFDGGRTTHALIERDKLRIDDTHADVDQVAARLRTLLQQRAPRLTPVQFEVNPNPTPYTGGQSGWLFRIRDHVHRKTYVWRQHTGKVMCWCDLDLRMSTVVWR